MSTQGPTQYITGLISNINWDEVVQKLMDLYREQRITPLEKKKEAVSSKISLLGELKGKLWGLKEKVEPFFWGDPFRTFSVRLNSPTVDPTKVLEASASRFASEGTYRIEVLQLAQAEVKASMGFSSGTDPLGVSGVLRLNGKEVLVEAGDSLFALAEKLNQAGAGVKATVFKASASEWRLVLEAQSPGSANALEIAEELLHEGEPFSFGFETVVQAQDAELKVNGLRVTRPDNTITDLIKGVTIRLISASPGATLVLEVKKDLEGLISKLEGLVSAYNEVASFIKEQFTYSEGEEKPLMGDVGLRIIQGGLGGILLGKIEGLPDGFNFLGFFGVSLKRDGSLEFDAAKFKERLSQDPGAAEAFFSQFASRMRDYLNQLLDPYGGFLKAKGDSMERQLQGLDRQVERQEELLEKERQRLYRRFISLEEVLGKIRSLSSWLSQQIEVSFKNYGSK